MLASDAVKEMPTGAENIDLPLLVIAMDQGAVGASGLYFAIFHQGLMILARWDPFHRCINDVRVASSETDSGKLRQAMLQSSYIFALAYGPFGKGSWMETKKARLRYFISRTNYRHPFFRKWAPLVAKGLGYPLNCESDYKLLWTAMASLKSFLCKGPLDKLSRWWSWWENFKFHVEDFWAAKMLYEFWVNGSQYADESEQDLLGACHEMEEQLKVLRQSIGGFKLAARLMNQGLLDNCWILFNVTKPVWEVFTELRSQVRSPLQAMVHYANMSTGLWRREIRTTNFLSRCRIQDLARPPHSISRGGAPRPSRAHQLRGRPYGPKASARQQRIMACPGRLTQQHA